MKCDVRSSGDVAKVPAADGVYNLAAVHRVPGHEAHEYWDTNVAGAKMITEYCRRHAVSSLTFTSSISVYGPRESACHEGSEPSPVHPYGESKLAAEAVHREWAAEDPARCLVIARPGVVFGPGEGGNFSRLAAAMRRRRFVYPGRRDTVKACIYVGELVRTLEFASSVVRSQPPGARTFVYNAAYPGELSIEQICAAFHNAGDLPSVRLGVPYRPMLAVGRAFEVAERLGLATGINRARIRKLVESTNIVPAALVNASYDFETDLAEGIRRWRTAAPTGQFV